MRELSVILAQATGGTMPYTSSWSDPTLSGAGPFRVCPTSPTEYTVTVSDSSGSAGEVQGTQQTVMATGKVDCTAPSPDASAPAEGALVGCQILDVAGAGNGVPEGGLDDAAVGDAGTTTECTKNEVDSSAAWADGGAVASVAAPLPGLLVAGQPYEFSFDRLLPISLSIGQSVTVEVFGANDPDRCNAKQKLFTMTLDGSIFNWNQNFCFTPTETYKFAITQVYIQGVLLYCSFGTTGTLCTGCSM